MKDRITIRNYRPSDLKALVALINEADAIDKLERATTLAQLEYEMSSPTTCPERDCFLAWQGGRLIGYTDLYFREGDKETDSVMYCWGVVHPDLRRRGVGRRLLAKSQGRAVEYGARMAATSISPVWPAIWNWSAKYSIVVSVWNQPATMWTWSGR
ncbi:GNAT family N-acetyltransferase [Chloroflexota bacterium]